MLYIYTARINSVTDSLPGLSLPAICESVETNEMIISDTRLWLQRSWVLGFHLLTNFISLSMRFLLLPHANDAMQSACLTWSMAKCSLPVSRDRWRRYSVRAGDLVGALIRITSLSRDTWGVMGVPAFFRWLSRKYPSIVVHCIEEKVSIAYFN